MSDNESDLAVREVDDAIRREYFENLWKSYRGWIIGGATLLVAAVAANEIYTSYTASARAARSDVFADAGRTAAETPDGAAGVWAKAAEQVDGSYADLALYRSAAAKYDEGDVEGAATDFEALGRRGSIDPALRDLARLNAAMIAADELDDFDKAKSLLVLVSGNKGAWSYSAREVLASLDMKQGFTAEATAGFEDLASDEKAPQSIRARANQFLERLRLDATLASEASDGSETSESSQPQATTPPAEESAEESASDDK